MDTDKRICAGLMLAALAGLSGFTACKQASEFSGSAVFATPDFEAEAPDVAGNYIAVRKGAIDGSRIVLEILVKDVTEPVSAIILKIGYPNQFSRFVSCGEGDLFPAGSASCVASETAPGSGEVFLVRALAAPHQPAPVGGEQVVLRAEFIVFGEGAGDLVFAAPNLGGSEASAVLDADGAPILVDWFAGRLLGL